MRALLRRLPRGVLDGLAEIRLTSGVRRLRPLRREHDDVDAVGRPVHERLPGVLAPSVLGTYFPRRRRIEIYAYATTDPGALSRVRPLVRAWGLATLAHEIAHHDDHVNRAKRDRWRADRESPGEHHAERVEHSWGTEHVVPLVEEAHAGEVAALSAWIEGTLGVLLPLSLLLGDPRTTRRDGLRALRWTVDHALATLLRGGEDGEQLRVEAAHDLLVADEYDLALAVLDGVLRVSPAHVAARVLRADALQRAGRDTEALASAEQVLEEAPGDPGGIRVALRGFTSAGRWADLLALSTRAMALSGAKRHDRATRSLAAIRALVELGRWREVDRAVSAFRSESPSRFYEAQAIGLHALSLLRRGESSAALAIAEHELAVRSRRTWWHMLLDAVRFEALHSLGRGRHAKPLVPAVRLVLQGQRFGEWCGRLDALGAWGSETRRPPGRA